MGLGRAETGRMRAAGLAKVLAKVLAETGRMRAVRCVQTGRVQMGRVQMGRVEIGRAG